MDQKRSPAIFYDQYRPNQSPASHRPQLRAANSTYSGRRNKPITKKQKRIVFTEMQVQELENIFLQIPYIDVLEREELAKRMGVTKNKIQTWFQNRRAKYRKELTDRQPLFYNLYPGWTENFTPSVASQPSQFLQLHCEPRTLFNLHSPLTSRCEILPGMPNQFLGSRLSQPSVSATPLYSPMPTCFAPMYTFPSLVTSNSALHRQSHYSSPVCTSSLTGYTGYAKKKSNYIPEKISKNIDINEIGRKI